MPEFSSSQPKRVEFFTFNGHDYTTLEKVPKAIALQVLEEIRKVGYEAVLPVMFEKVLGEADYQRFLTDVGQIEDENYDWIQAEIEAKVMGAVEGLGEGSRAGGKKSAGS